MPGFELIGREEKNQLNSIFSNGGIFFRQGFENLRKNSFKVLEFEKKFSKHMGSKYALAVTSGTAALRVALASLNLKKGDEVITQSFTFVATVEAIIESNLTPVCCDVNETLNIDPTQLKKLINKKTKVLIVVHMLGVSPEMDEIIKICKKNKILIIEDTAWGCGGFYGKKRLGTLGRIGTFSFDFAKTITTGEGGMLLFKKKIDFERARAWHDHGHENNPKVPRWEDTRSSSGFNYRMTELQGAVGIAQLKKLEKIISIQKKNKKLIQEKIKKLKLEFRKIPKKNKDTCDALIFFVKNKQIAKKCREALNNNGIKTKILPEATTWHFSKFWGHMNALKKKHKNLKRSFLKSEKFINRAISIPITIKMDKKFPDLIYRSLKKII